MSSFNVYDFKVVLLITVFITKLFLISKEKIMQEINGIENYQLLNGDVKQISLMTMFRSIYYRRQLIVVVMVFLQGKRSTFYRVKTSATVFFHIVISFAAQIFLAFLCNLLKWLCFTIPCLSFFLDLLRVWRESFVKIARKAKLKA